jgi:hypothetical protein
MSVERIGSKERMLNGSMRAGFVANKYTLDISWTMVPTAAQAGLMLFKPAAKIIGTTNVT